MTKKEALLKIFELGGSAMVHLDPRVPGVSVPEQCRKDCPLTLHVSMDMPVPIPDLDVNDHELRGTLSFNRQPYYCNIPWTSVFAMAGQGPAKDARVCWPHDAPAELRRMPLSADRHQKAAAVPTPVVSPQKPAKVVSLADYRRRKQSAPGGAA